MESKVDEVLRRLLESGLSFDYAMVRRLSAPAPPTVPELKLPGTVDLGLYDRAAGGRCTMIADTGAPSAVAERVRELCR